MKTRLVTINDISINNLTRYGRKRNEAIWAMMDKGCEVITEYRENCNSRVYIGYKNKYNNSADCVTRVRRNGIIEQKETKAMCSPFSGGMKSYFVAKTKEDRKGNIDFLRRIINVKNGETVFEDELKINTKTRAGLEYAKNELCESEQ